MTDSSSGPPGTAAAHGSIRLIEPACTSCMICARECPSWCISIDSHTEPVPDLPAGTRERTHNVLDRFEIDWSLCMYCGICVDECPFDALEWVTDPTRVAYAAPDLRTTLSGLPELLEPSVSHVTVGTPHSTHQIR